MNQLLKKCKELPKNISKHFIQRPYDKAIEILESIVGDENLNVNNKSIATIMLYRLYYNHFPNKAIDLLFSAIEIDKKKMMSSFQYMSD